MWPGKDKSGESYKIAVLRILKHAPCTKPNHNMDICPKARTS
jgi:hypothetical protein